MEGQQLLFAAVVVGAFGDKTRQPFAKVSTLYMLLMNVFVPRHEKTCFQSFRQSEIQTNLFSYRD